VGSVGAESWPEKKNQLAYTGPDNMEATVVRGFSYNYHVDPCLNKSVLDVRDAALSGGLTFVE